VEGPLWRSKQNMKPSRSREPEAHCLLLSAAVFIFDICPAVASTAVLDRLVFIIHTNLISLFSLLAIFSKTKRIMTLFCCLFIPPSLSLVANGLVYTYKRRLMRSPYCPLVYVSTHTQLQMKSPMQGAVVNRRYACRLLGPGTVTWRLKARIVEPGRTATARQHLVKNCFRSNECT
jgi:hypothetical protein